MRRCNSKGANPCVCLAACKTVQAKNNSKHQNNIKADSKGEESNGSGHSTKYQMDNEVREVEILKCLVLLKLQNLWQLLISC